MKRLSYCISAFLMLAAFTVNGQGKIDLGAKNFQRAQARAARTGVAVKSLGSQSVSAESRVAVFITLDEPSSVGDLVASGIEVEDVYGTIAVAYVTADDLSRLETMQSVKKVERTCRKRLLNNTVRSTTSVDPVHQGTELPQPFTGEGVIVGVVDGGFDPNHIMFKDKDGGMRVKKFWKYTVNAYTGRVTTNTYTGSQLTAFTTDDNAATHATHVSGIAAGSYNVGTSSGYYGVAPGADILMVGGDMTDQTILAGAKELCDYAKNEGKPLVINMSLGDNIGPHDGTDAFTTALNSIAKDNVICLAAGNEGDLDIVIKKELTAKDNTIKTTLIPNSDLLANNSRNQAYCDVQVWGADNSAFNVKFALVHKGTGEAAFTMDITNQERYVSCGTMFETGDISDATFNSAYTNSFVGGIKGVSSENRRYCAQLTFDLTNKTNSKTYLPAIIVEGNPGQTIYVYNDAYYNEFSTSGLAGYDSTTKDGTISNMACGQHTIAVGAYASKTNSWTTNGNVAPFSSWGTLVDGRTLPHVSAPGIDIVSAMSTPYYNSAYYSSVYDPIAYSVTLGGKKYTWSKMSGTSMSTPVMTGVAALWAQAMPEITPQEVCEVAISTAQNTAQTVQWGAGKLDAYEGLKKVLQMASVENVTDREEARLLIKDLGNRCFEIFMPGNDLLNVTLYNMSGAAVAASQGNEVAVIDASGVTPGVYVLKATNGKNISTSKLVIH